MRSIERIIYLIIILLLIGIIFYLTVWEKIKANNGVPISIGGAPESTTLQPVTESSRKEEPTRPAEVIREKGTSDIFDLKELTYKCEDEDVNYYDLYINNVKIDLGLEQGDACGWQTISDYVVNDIFAVLKVTSVPDSDKVYIVDKNGKLLTKFEDLHIITDFYIVNKHTSNREVYIQGYTYFEDFCELDKNLSAGGLYKLEYDGDSKSFLKAKKIGNFTLEDFNNEFKLCNE